MRIDPSIRALCGNPVAQRRSQQALECAAASWRTSGRNAAVLAELDRYGAGEDLCGCPALSALTSDLIGAREFVGHLVAALVQALDAQPLGHVPFRHQVSDGFTVLQLARAGRAMLSLVQYDSSGEAPRSVSFSDGERREICMGGTAAARRVAKLESTKDRARLMFVDEPLEPGSTAAYAGCRETKIVDRVDRPMTLLRLSRSVEGPDASLEYRLADGVLLHRAAGDCRESRNELMLAVLGRMGRRGAVPAMLGLARAGSDSLRWQALRECIALDSEAGFRELARIADDQADALRRPAVRLRRDLLARYPQFARLEPALCPA